MKLSPIAFISVALVLFVAGGCQSSLPKEPLLDRIKRTKTICRVEEFRTGKEDEFGSVFAFSNLYVMADAPGEVGKLVDFISQGTEPMYHELFAGHLAALVFLDENSEPLAVVKMAPCGRLVVLQGLQRYDSINTYWIPDHWLQQRKAVRADGALRWTYEWLRNNDNEHLEERRNYYRWLELDLEHLIFGFETYEEYISSTNKPNDNTSDLLLPRLNP